MKQRIYIDTSVIGGYFDKEFEYPTKKLFDRIINKDFIVYFSEVNETELFLTGFLSFRLMLNQMEGILE